MTCIAGLDTVCINVHRDSGRAPTRRLDYGYGLPEYSIAGLVTVCTPPLHPPFRGGKHFSDPFVIFVDTGSIAQMQAVLHVRQLHRGGKILIRGYFLSVSPTPPRLISTFYRETTSLNPANHDVPVLVSENNSDIVFISMVAYTLAAAVLPKA